MHLARISVVVVPWLALAACSSDTFGTGTTSDAGGDASADAGGDGDDAAGQADSATSDGGVPDDGGGGADAGPPSGSVSGAISGQSFGSILTAVWIGHPAACSRPIQVYLSDAAVSCATMGAAAWDKNLGASHLLEIDVDTIELRTFTVGVDADANLTAGSLNPSATAGTVAVGAVAQDQWITGTFSLAFKNDTIAGDFHAVYCATGVEP